MPSRFIGRVECGGRARHLACFQGVLRGKTCAYQAFHLEAGPAVRLFLWAPRNSEQGSVADERAYAHHRATGQERSKAPAGQDQEPRAQGLPSAPGRLHARLHHHPQEAELRAPQGRPRPTDLRGSRSPPTSPASATTSRSTPSCSCAPAASATCRACATRSSAARSTPPVSRTGRRPVALRRQEGRRVAVPRKGPAARRDIEPDPVYQNVLVTQLINKVLLDGKKTLSRAHRLQGARGHQRAHGERPGDHAEEGGRERAPDARGQVAAGRRRELPGAGRGAPRRGTTLALRWLVNYSRARARSTRWPSAWSARSWTRRTAPASR